MKFFKLYSGVYYVRRIDQYPLIGEQFGNYMPMVV
jgi:hypothetical protein